MHYTGQRKHWELEESFPRAEVIAEYANPKVDMSKDKFSWGKPDYNLLRALCREKFCWDSAKTEQILAPVIKACEEREVQLRLDSFVTFSERFSKIKSKRMQQVVRKQVGHVNPELVPAYDQDDGAATKPKKPKKKRAAPKAGAGATKKKAKKKAPAKKAKPDVYRIYGGEDSGAIPELE